MYRYALRPRWLLSHLFALSMVVLFVNLGFWQLRRHDERQARNHVVEARAELAPEPIGALVDGQEPDELRFRAASASGTYGPETVLVDNRSADGLPGGGVLAPLRLDDGRVLVVNRGFAGYVSGELDIPSAPTGPVAVEGTLVPWDGDCGVRRDDDGRVEGMACLRRDAAAEAFGADEVLPVVVQVTGSDPASPPQLSAVPLPELGSGPHRGYAGQWFIFATIIAVVYVLILRKVARERAAEHAEADAPSDADDDGADRSTVGQGSGGDRA